jgi:hypothetical protein
MRLEIVDETIVVMERNDTLLKFRLVNLLPDGGTLPYTLEGAPTIEFYVKDDPSATDPTANAGDGTPFKQTTGLTIVADGTAPGATYSELNVQLAAGNVPLPKTRYYRLDVIKASKRETVKKGLFKVENV